MSDPQVTVVTPFHAARVANGMLERAAASVRAQTVPVHHLMEEDATRSGASATRQRGLERVATPWTAFLDSDDEMDPDHIEELLKCAEETGADYVYPWFRVVGGTDPFPMFFGKPWDDAAPHSTTVTILVKTDVAQRIGFRSPQWEDWDFTLRCVASGVRIVHLPRRSWTWYHHGKNSQGTPGRGDAS